MVNYLIKAQCSGYYASQIILDHQSELNVYVGKSQVTVKKQRLLTQCAEGVRQGDGNQVLPTPPLPEATASIFFPLRRLRTEGPLGATLSSSLFSIFSSFQLQDRINLAKDCASTSASPLAMEELTLAAQKVRLQQSATDNTVPIRRVKSKRVGNR